MRPGFLSPNRRFGFPPVLLITLVATLGMTGCTDDEPTGPEMPGQAGLLVLNSTGQTLAPFSVGEFLQAAGSPIDLGPSFDGQTVEAWEDRAVSTVSSFGGSLIVLVDLQSGEVFNATFPGPEGAEANPSAASFDESGTVWVGGRGSDALYRLDTGSSEAEEVAAGIGTFVERVIPVGNLLYAIDANIDDEAFTYEPIGPGRVVVLTRDGTLVQEVTFPEGVVNAFDAVVAGDDLVVLATGSFGADFQPSGDGHLVIVRLADAGVRAVHALEANGLWLELGANGDVYVTTTSDFVTTEVLRYDPGSDAFLNGPGRGIEIVDPSGSPVTCWVAMGLADDRVLCATFAYAEAGRLILAEADGSFIDELPSGFGSRDLLMR